ncbi:MAG: hypothetical protein H7Z42_18490, partial [Roseiflexaceae bacterium]|nr:hypothetical protein [Roseiflexaceae bacterium]
MWPYHRLRYAALALALATLCSGTSGPARASETPPSEQAPADGPRAAWDR